MQRELLATAGILLALEGLEFLRVRRESSDVFSIKFGWRVFYCLFIGALLPSLWHHQSDRVWLWLALGAFVLLRPKNLAITPTGLASYAFWGLHRRFVAWSDVLSVTSDWEEEHFKVWTFNGYRVSVTGLDGTRIDHTIFQRHQGRFLDDIRAQVPTIRFAPGLADWHP